MKHHCKEGREGFPFLLFDKLHTLTGLKRCAGNETYWLCLKSSREAGSSPSKTAHARGLYRANYCDQSHTDLLDLC